MVSKKHFSVPIIYQWPDRIFTHRFAHHHNGQLGRGAKLFRLQLDRAFPFSGLRRRDSGAEGGAVVPRNRARSPVLMLWTAFHPSTRTRVLYRREAGMEGTMTPVTTIGLDIAKTVFQVHGVNAAGQVVVRQRLTRGRVLAFFEKLTPCLVGIEACGNSHYWARELTARGHVVRLMPAQYVKPYVKRGKNDAADAEAICELSGDPRCALCP